MDAKKFLDAIRHKMNEMNVDIFDYEIARDFNKKPPLGALLDLLLDKTEYILNDIRCARVIADTPACAQGDEPHDFEEKESDDDNTRTLVCTKCGEPKVDDREPNIKQD